MVLIVQVFVHSIFLLQINHKFLLGINLKSMKNKYISLFKYLDQRSLLKSKGSKEKTKLEPI